MLVCEALCFLLRNLLGKGCNLSTSQIHGKSRCIGKHCQPNSPYHAHIELPQHRLKRKRTGRRYMALRRHLMCAWSPGQVPSRWSRRPERECAGHIVNGE
jgi:hypothetical protein